jgi:dihydroorotase-like cyclic amidohydrolase
MLNSTKDISSLEEPLAYDKKNGGYLFGKVMFTKKIDDIDWRAMEKAFNEIAARLPVKLVIHSELQRIIEQRKLRHYEATKQHHKHLELKPELWDLGKEANSVYDKVKPSAAE